MSTGVIDRPSHTAADLTRKPDLSPRQEEPLAAGEVLTLLGGCGLLAYGLWRRSWFGLAAAALGGLLIYRGLTRVVSRNASPDSVGFTTAGAVPAEEPISPDAQLTPGQGTASQWVTLPAGQVAALAFHPWPGGGELTPAEHARAEVRAYYFALERGGGGLPPYDPAKAVEDFCRAAVTSAPRQAPSLVLE
jgi:hypothetical protein